MRKTIAYIRVSTSEQADRGFSLPAQEHKIRQYAELYGYTIDDVIQDAGISAKSLDRAGFQRIIQMMNKKEIGTLIIAKLDRMTRNIKDLAEIVELCNKKDISLVSIGEHLDTGTAAGRMILNMLGVISQWERETIGERTSTALQYKKQSGKVYNCNALFGYENQNGQLIPVDSEQETITLMIHLREQGSSFNSIADKLNSMGISCRSGKQWHSEQVRRVIQHTEDRKAINSSVQELTK